MTAKDAKISPCGKYRYSLTRIWEPGLPKVYFIMLNPSTADALVDDPTIRRCVGFAKEWGYGGIKVLNLFAVRTAFPKEMMEASDPVGPENYDEFERMLTSEDPLIVCAWGVHGAYMDQDLTVLGWIEHLNPKCLGLSKDGHPRHPLYLPKKVNLQEFKGRDFRG